MASALIVPARLLNHCVRLCDPIDREAWCAEVHEVAKSWTSACRPRTGSVPLAAPRPDGTWAVTTGAASGPCSMRTMGPGFAGGRIPHLSEAPWEVPSGPRQKSREIRASLGFSRQEHWSGLPLPSPMHACMLSCFSHVRLCATLWAGNPYFPRLLPGT